MNFLLGDTICALATPAGRSGVAVWRISGPHAGDVLRALTGNAPLPAPRMAKLATLSHPDSGEPIDRGLVLWFPAPASFTGEDVVELQLHGSLAVSRELSELLPSLDGVRLAEPGEFTRRAFLHGQMDLLEAEGLADLIDAETSAQRQQALRQMEGTSSAIYSDWRTRLVHTLAHLEAYIDFPDEEIPDEVMEHVNAAVRSLREEMQHHCGQTSGEQLREGLQIAIIGPPNAGKSSLLNALARRDVAIVTEVAGTTRDIVEAHLDIGGVPVTFADTAGIRETQDQVEQEGISRARARAHSADWVMFVHDASEDIPHALCPEKKDNLLVIHNKIDIYPHASFPEDRELPGISVSAHTGQGIDKLMEYLEKNVVPSYSSGEIPLITRARHRQELEQCCDRLSAFFSERELELQCEYLRSAAFHLGQITGHVDVEELLDEIFSSFCIGK